MWSRDLFALSSTCEQLDSCQLVDVGRQGGQPVLFQIKQAKMDSGARQSLEQRDLSVSSVDRPPYTLDFIAEMGRN